jgi:hypothetical protein
MALTLSPTVNFSSLSQAAFDLKDFSPILDTGENKV